MKVAVFGATGRLGRPLVERLLASGHEITALVRDPSQLVLQHELLHIVKGDATSFTAVEGTISDVDIVISAMATSASQKIAKTKPLTCATQNITAAMKKSGKRVANPTCCGGAG